MRKCFCRMCGTENQIEDNENKYVCSSCGVENNAPKPKNVEEIYSYSTPVYNSEPVVTPTESVFSATSEASDKPKEKKKTGLIVTLVLLFGIIIASAILLLLPIKSFLPIRFNCDECKKIKYSQKYEVEYEGTDKVESLYICDDCFKKEGYEERDN